MAKGSHLNEPFRTLAEIEDLIDKSVNASWDAEETVAVLKGLVFSVNALVYAVLLTGGHTSDDRFRAYMDALDD